jgi:hypothetical protein
MVNNGMELQPEPYLLEIPRVNTLNRNISPPFCLKAYDDLQGEGAVAAGALNDAFFLIRQSEIDAGMPNVVTVRHRARHQGTLKLSFREDNGLSMAAITSSRYARFAPSTNNCGDDAKACKRLLEL